LFNLQDQIVVEIAAALKLTLVKSEHNRLLERGTRSVPAYLAYLRGEHARNTLAINRLYEALEYFATATELDPDFARAWLGIGKVYGLLGSIDEISRTEAREHVQSYVARALALDHTLGEAYAVQAMAIEINPSVAGDPAKITERNALLDKAMSFSPNDPAVLEAYATVMCSPMEKDYGCHARKAALLKEVIRRDPNNLNAYLKLGWTFVALDHDSVPGLLFEESIRRNADFIPGYTDLALWHWGSNNIDWKRSVVCLCEAVDHDPENPVPLTMLASIHVDMGLTDEADDFLDRAGETGESLEVFTTFNKLKLHLYRGQVEEAADYARKHLPEIGLGSYGILAYGAILESALRKGSYNEDIALFESTFETINIPIEYKDGYILSRSAALLAAPLAELHFAAGNAERAKELVAGAKAYFEREITKGSVWRPSNTWAYSAVLAQSGMTTSAVMELEHIPAGYLRNAWYVSRTPLLANLAGYGRFDSVIREIDDRIAQQRRNVASIPSRLPPCLTETTSRLPGILALTIPVVDPDSAPVTVAASTQ
jgi:tetratricopeptide (TPR) repeat protein